MDELAGVAPFIGLIVGSYDTAAASAASKFRYFHIRETKTSSSSRAAPVPYPMLLRVSVRAACHAAMADPAVRQSRGSEVESSVSEPAPIQALALASEPQNVQKEVQAADKKDGVSKSKGGKSARDREMGPAEKRQQMQKQKQQTQTQTPLQQVAIGELFKSFKLMACVTCKKAKRGALTCRVNK